MWFIFHFQLFVWFLHLLSLPTKIFQNILFAIHIAYAKIWFFFLFKKLQNIFLICKFCQRNVSSIYKSTNVSRHVKSSKRTMVSFKHWPQWVLMYILINFFYYQLTHYKQFQHIFNFWCIHIEIVHNMCNTKSMNKLINIYDNICNL